MKGLGEPFRSELVALIGEVATQRVEAPLLVLEAISEATAAERVRLLARLVLPCGAIDYFERSGAWAPILPGAERRTLEGTLGTARVRELEARAIVELGTRLILDGASAADVQAASLAVLDVVPADALAQASTGLGQAAELAAAIPSQEVGRARLELERARVLVEEARQAAATAAEQLPHRRLARGRPVDRELQLIAGFVLDQLPPPERPAQRVALCAGLMAGLAGRLEDETTRADIARKALRREEARRTRG